MGCSFSRKDINDINPNVFRVYNVDDQGRELKAGKIAISEGHLILYQKSKDAIRWPLRCLRRYGFDAELFSFESGRRCPTGPGIYAFKCSRAEALFNLLQECIQRAGQEEQVNRSIHLESSRPNSVIDMPHQNSSLVPNGTAPLPPQTSENGHHYVNGQIASERAVEHPPSPSRMHEYVNTPAVASSQRDSANLDVNSVFVDVTDDTLLDNASNAERQLNYAVLDLPGSNSTENLAAATALANSSRSKGVKYVETDSVFFQASASHGDSLHGSDGEGSASQPMYVNIGLDIPKTTSVKQRRPLVKQNSCDQHGYANLELVGTCTPPRIQEPGAAAASTSAAGAEAQVNYIQLDLEKGSDNASTGPSTSPTSPVSLTPSNPESPSRRTESYAMIDFNKTAALSNSAKPKAASEDDEGYRKTRHNSNIDELYWYWCICICLNVQ